MQPYIVNPEMQNWSLELTGLAKPGKPPRLMGIGPDLAPQEAACQVFGSVWNRTDALLRSNPKPLVGYPDPLLTLPTSTYLTSLDQGNQVHCWVHLFNTSIQMHLSTHSITSFKCISKFTPSYSPGASPIALEYHMQPDLHYVYQ